MTPTETRTRILTLLAARRGGTTVREIVDILDIPYADVKYAVRRLLHHKQVTQHGHVRREVPRYTLPDDPLTRPIAPIATSEARLKLYRQRKAIVIAALAKGPRSHRHLARLCGVQGSRPGILGTLERMRVEGVIERMGESVGAKYRLTVGAWAGVAA